MDADVIYAERYFVPRACSISFEDICSALRLSNDLFSVYFEFYKSLY